MNQVKHERKVLVKCWISGKLIWEWRIWWAMGIAPSHRNSLGYDQGWAYT